MKDLDQLKKIAVLTPISFRSACDDFLFDLFADLSDDFEVKKAANGGGIKAYRV